METRAAASSLSCCSRRSVARCSSLRKRSTTLLERFGFDALFAPARAPMLVFRTCCFQVLLLLAHRFAQAVEKRAVILQLDGIHRAVGLRGITHVLVTVFLQLLQLLLEIGDFFRRLHHWSAQVLSGRQGDFLDGLESFRFHHGQRTIARCTLGCRELRHELLEIGITSFNSDGFVHILTQEIQHFRPLIHRQVDTRVGSPSISAYRNQVAILLICGVHLLEARGEIQLLARCDAMHGATDRSLDVDGWVYALLPQATR